MKRGFILITLACLMFLSFTGIVSASYSDLTSLFTNLLSKNFAGTVIDTKANGIKEAEETGYTCQMAGTSIEIYPQKKSFPSSYYIPSNVTSKTGNSLAINQEIMGKYSSIGKTTITCTKTPPPSTKTVTLSTIKIYANSKTGGSYNANGTIYNYE